MNFLAFFFILSTFYYLVNKSHLLKNVDQKLIMYDNKNWILFDIIYYLHQIFYWVWIFALFFTEWNTFGFLLLMIGIASSVDIWLFSNKYDNILSLIKIFFLFCLIVAPFFSDVLR
jgi:hypothetical protein